ncbi:PRC-barrel domain-containing protein [Falsirhodobacter sp. alg1]|uniref:PRC-barrel domain-containing protein n=1 Tax=Falsirhodobacter sp. alg1 TaxID=1472418 RepID=UPI0005EDC593|nr:PRC-barrel domain-containing protein [Falsirhodobacter sp. alg1]
MASTTISSKDVDGTAVYSPSGDRLGHIDHLRIDKELGYVAYAVMGFGGFLGVGEGHHPVPWKKLRYDTSLNGYVTDITEEQLQKAPRQPEETDDNRQWATTFYGYYGVAPYWV